MAVPGGALAGLAQSLPTAIPAGPSRAGQIQHRALAQMAQSGSQWELITFCHVRKGGRDSLCALINFMQPPIWGFKK